jgi:hypothetical protein
MRKLFVSITLLILTSCSNIPAPSILLPSENLNIQKASFGDPPTNYQKILKDYLIGNMNSFKRAKVEFINQPRKISINHLGNTYSGYRVCLSINEKKGEYYRGYKNHFFLINNNKVSLHLFDSGLLKIPFEYCVTRNTINEIYVEDIPEKDALTIDDMDNVDLQKQDEISTAKLEEDLFLSNTYILCTVNNVEYTYIFNEKDNTFRKLNGLNEIIYEVTFNEAYIVASKENIEITINRVSGKSVEIQDKKSISGMCKLLDKTKF